MFDHTLRRRLSAAILSTAVAAAIAVPVASDALGTTTARSAASASSAAASASAGGMTAKPKKAKSCRKLATKKARKKCRAKRHAAATAGASAPGVTGAAGTPTTPTTPGTTPTGPTTPWTARGEDYAKTVTISDLKIPMDDGVVLRGDLTVPVGPDGKAVTTPLPVIVTITAYNKSAMTSPIGAMLAGASPTYLVKRGYAQLTVDARGTGSSPGTWAAFSAREGKDAGKVVEWAASQTWSNGSVGMTGPSYMGISQLFAAGQHPKGLKAIFPQVPAADVYRDVVASGGQIDVGFIPLWMGLVTGTGIIPPAYTATDPASGLGALTDHLMGLLGFTAPMMVNALLDGEPAYDGPFYAERSPINVLDDVTVPTFLVGGEFDLFQRGTGLDFEKLQNNGAPVKMILGPWDHLQGSSGADIGLAGHGSLAELQLRWFDHYLKGQDTQLDAIPALTYYEQGSGAWVHANKWIDADLHARSFALSGTSMVGGKAGVLATGTPTAGTSMVPAIPVTGLCTRSANQWTAGLPNMLLKDMPCFKDNKLNDYGGLTFDTGPLTEKVRFQGPLNARLYVSTPTGDGMLSVAVEDVAPDGTVSRITGGWQTIAHRALDESKSRYLDGKLLQAYHPYTKAAKKSLPAGAVAPVDVEIFPTGAVILPGHKLRIAVQAFDVPHLLSPVTDLLPQLAPLTLRTGPSYPSELTMAVRP